MANNLEERLNALKGKQDNVGDQFGSDDIRTLVEGIEYAMSHGGTVSVTITALEDGSGYKITIIDSEGGAHEATLKNGGDAYEVYKSTVPEGQSPMTKEEWLETLKGADGADGQDGADGAPGHNPNLGTFLDTDTDKPTTGQAGDYFIVINTNATPKTANVWAWNGSTFANTEKSVENFGVQFASGQPVANVHIKDEYGIEVGGTAHVMSAEAGKKLGITVLGQEKTLHVAEEDLTVGYFGAKNGDGKGIYDSNSTYGHAFIPVTPNTHLTCVNENVPRQYAFIKSYTSNVEIVYCDNTDRYTYLTSIEHTLVPSDCKYLYVMLILGSSRHNIDVDVDEYQNIEGLVEKVDKASTQITNINNNVNELNYDMASLEPVINRLDNFKKVYKFSAANASHGLFKNGGISLNSIGDYVEFVIDNVVFGGNTNFYSYAFFTVGSDYRLISISINNNPGNARDKFLLLRDSNNTQILSTSNSNTGDVVGKKVRIEYSDTALKVYIDGVEKHSIDYVGSIPPVIALGGIGKYYYSSTSYYNDFELKDFVVKTGDTIIKGLEDSVADFDNTNISVEEEGSFLSEEEQEKLENVEVSPSVLAKKLENELDVYVKCTDGSYIKYPLVHRYAEYEAGAYPSYYDNWGIGRCRAATLNGGIMTDGEYLFYHGEAELAINVELDQGNDSKYVGGGAHGFENISTVYDMYDSFKIYSKWDFVTYNGHAYVATTSNITGEFDSTKWKELDINTRSIIFLINGKEIAETATLGLTPVSVIEVIQKSTLRQAYQDSSVEPWAEVTKHWVWNEKGLSITTSVKVLKSKAISQAQFGMMCVYRHVQGNNESPYLAKYAVKDSNPYRTFEVIDGWESSTNYPENYVLTKRDDDCSEIKEYGDTNYSFAMKITDATLKSDGGMKVGTNNSPYNKIYFDLTGVYTPIVDEELKATQNWFIDKLKDSE